MTHIPRYFLAALVIGAIECIVLVYNLIKEDVEVTQENVSGVVASPNAVHSIAPHQFSKNDRESQMEKILGRPLFDVERRSPPIIEIVPGASVVSLPRPTATMITKNERIAIFIGDNGKSEVFRIGEKVSGMNVLYIEPGKVGLEGPGGLVVLKLRPDSARAATAASFIAEKTTMPITVVGSSEKRAIEPADAHMWGNITNLPKPEPMSIPRHY